jgi:hypothetical protein
MLRFPFIEVPPYLRDVPRFVELGLASAACFVADEVSVN